MKLKLKLDLCLFLMAAAGCTAKMQFVQVVDGHFVRDGKPYTYIGTNFWYGPILASEGQGGDYARLCLELDTLKALGLENRLLKIDEPVRNPGSCSVPMALAKAPPGEKRVLIAGFGAGYSAAAGLVRVL